ncbi:hypothetical protein TrLO_g14251 [Triparma laevis f. longispina]|uniref:Pyridoxamine 5'-phosphate oxidase Alr4036 family FMN-binding domain-containing protein n=1 Tax=Triparma laevis f. longispina TaxID=1714387 RepID=A0A9W7FLT4_9STRA|nr:hypothetical protein TrLO_g14251 [Triparma laevis f. longispina]
MASLHTRGGEVSEGLADIGGEKEVGGGGVGGGEEITSWRERIAESIAKSRKVRGGNFVQIATVDGSGLPRCRTVVFRGFLDDLYFREEQTGAPMKMITDERSEKVKEARLNPGCEMVYWFGKTSEQYRIFGDLMFVGGGGSSGGDADTTSNEERERQFQIARKSQWGNLSDNAREQFYWSNPGQPYSGSGEAPPPGGRDSEGKVLPVPDTFLLVLLWPKEVKYLRLTDNFAQIDKLEEGWTACRVNP